MDDFGNKTLRELSLDPHGYREAQVNNGIKLLDWI